MEEKKEVQATIINPVQNNNKSTEEEFLNILRSISPGTHLRAGIDGALKSGRGALIVVENENLHPIIDGGFKVNCRFTSQKLIELSKMDGAIILSKDMKKINYANVLLVPESKISSNETGTRHKAAERTAKSIGGLVIAISERRNETTVYYKNIRHILKTTDEILRKVNENIQLLEKHRELFDKHTERLNRLEVRNYPSLSQAINVIQRGILIEKISGGLRRQIIEIGNEGALLKTRLKELVNGVEKETNLVIKDYTKLDVRKSRILLESLSYDELTDEKNILGSLAYESINQNASIKGWRILSKTSLPEPDLANLIKKAETLGKALHSNINEVTSFLEADKAQAFKEEIQKIKLSQ